MYMDINIVISILSGIATTIPLIVALVKYIQKAVKEKNWSIVLNLVMKYMEEAEKQYESGAEKKQYVLAMIKASANEVNYDIDMETVSKLIDDLCSMSKKVNAPEE